MDSQYSQNEMSDVDLGREIDRRQIEVNLIEQLVDVFNPDLQVSDHGKRVLVDNLKTYTLSWQTPPYSGSVGEVMTRWVGSGFLKDFPVFKDYEFSDGYNVVDIEPDGNDSNIRAAIVFEIDDEYKSAIYEFHTNRELVTSREKQLRLEINMYKDLISSQLQKEE